MDQRWLALAGVLPVLAIALAITFWPTIYALIRKRPDRAVAYFIVSLIGFSISALVAPWWEARNPDGDWEFGSPGFLYYGLSWPVTTSVAWLIAAVSDAVLAVKKTDDSI